MHIIEIEQILSQTIDSYIESSANAIKSMDLGLETSQINQIIDDTYEIIAGERRWRAAKLAGLDEIPAVILDGDDLKIAQVAIIENVQREDLNAVEEALGYRTLIDTYSLTQEEVAKRMGKSRAAVTNALRLLNLTEEELSALRSGSSRLRGRNHILSEAPHRR